MLPLRFFFVHFIFVFSPFLHQFDVVFVCLYYWLCRRVTTHFMCRTKKNSSKCLSARVQPKRDKDDFATLISG